MRETYVYVLRLKQIVSIYYCFIGYLIILFQVLLTAKCPMR